MAARRRTSFSCSRSRLRFLSSRISASSASVRPSRTPSSISARFTHRCRHDSEIPKSFAIWDIGTSLRRATATTSRRNSRGNAFGICCLLPVRVILTDQESTKGWAVPNEGSWIGRYALWCQLLFGVSANYGSDSVSGGAMGNWVHGSYQSFFWSEGEDCDRD